MSITSLNPLSNFYQQPLTPSREEEPEETVYHWDVNEHVVYLIKEHNCLKYKTIDGNKKEIYCNDIDLPEEGDLEQEISYLKKCKVMVEENGAARFCKTYHTWENAHKEQSLEVSLIRGNECLIWNVFQENKKASSFYCSQEATIPSLRCHSETIALIEKIKAEAFNNPQHVLCLIRDFKVRVVEPKKLKKEYERLSIELHETVQPYLGKVFLAGGAGSLGSTYLSCSAISAAAGTTYATFGSGVFGAAVAGIGAIASTAIVSGGGLIAAAGITAYSLSAPYALQEKVKLLKKRVEITPQRYPLLIEIEPISEPSVFDPRVRVSKFTWAVTVITTEGFSSSHAAIIVEGINDGFFNREACLSIGAEVEIGEKFIYLADFNPPVRACLLSPSELKYLKRTEIWMRTSDKVQEMMRNIREELLNGTRWFNIRGKNALFPNITTTKKKFITFSDKPGDNCYTFSREHLKTLDIDPDSSYLDFIAAMARLYTKDPESYKSLPVQVTI